MRSVDPPWESRFSCPPFKLLGKRRRTQSKNNIKQLVLAIHNYHDVNSHFPAGTHPNKDLQPGKRLSWIAEILPYLELSPVHKQIDFK